MADPTLADLLQHTPHSVAAGPPPDSITVVAVRQDSRAIAAGDCFVAVPGFSVDGHQFLAQAVAAGATAVVVQADRRAQWEAALTDAEVAVIEVEDSRIALADLAAARHKFPARRLTVIGVTGTDGKTTTSYLTHALLSAAGHDCGLVNGVEFHIGGEWRANESGETTPEADLLQPLLAEMVAAGQTHAVIETSSHGLELQRVRNCDFDIALFTGLSDDHLDFHNTRERYLSAKLSLFEALDEQSSAGRERFAVVRAEDPLRETIAGAHSRRTILASNGDAPDDAEVTAQPLSQDAAGAQLRVVTPGGALAARLRLPGAFNVGNAALAVGAAWGLGVRPTALQRGFADARAVPGRMEPIDEGQSFGVIVDAAATGPALRAALEALRPHVTGRLLLVFGAAGERDPARRSGMGAVAAELADHSFITSENPRSEDPAQIVAEIAEAMRNAGAAEHLVEEPNRRAAIRRALAEAQPDDLVLIAGKGAEPTLIFADHTDPWDDRTVAGEELRRLRA